MLLFKYLSPTGVAKVLEDRSSLSLRFQLPKDFNDPYELFLQPNSPLSNEEHRAFYEFFLGDVVQAPAIAFSRRPDSVTMWAHYASEGSGAVVALDEDALASQFTLAYLGDVDYSDQPAKVDRALIVRAFETGKRRDALNLLSAAHRAAFFMKRTDWQYERERRLVVANDMVQANGDLLTITAPTSHVRHIILGARATADVRSLCEARASEFGVPLLEFRTGKKHVEPFFVQPEGPPLTWRDPAFELVVAACKICGEPADVNSDGACMWCGISADARKVASKRNMLAATLQYGIDPGVPLEFDGLEPRGGSATEHAAAMKQRREFPGAEDVVLQLKLYHAMKEAGHIK